MPIYEYKCADCRKIFSVLCKISEVAEHPNCEMCGSTSTHRLVSRFRTVRSEDQILESMADPAALAGIDENDPRSIARWAKKMAREMGEDMGDEIEALAEEELSKSSNIAADEQSEENSSDNAAMTHYTPEIAEGK